MRGLFGSLSRGVTKAAIASVPSASGLIPPLGSIPSASGLLISQATAMAVSSVYACVNIRARDVARCTPSLYSEAKDHTRTKIEPDKHPVARLLVRPNRVQTWFEFMRDAMVGLLLRGNAYAVILRDGKGNPTELIQVNPDAVMVLEASDGSWFYNVNRLGLFQIAMLRNQPVAIPSEDVLHLRGISFNMLVAASTIGLARDSIGVHMGMTQQQARWIANGARPSVVLKSAKALTVDAAKRLKQTWNDYNAGIQNVGGTAVLEDGVEAQELKLDAAQLEFIQQFQFTVQDVARFYSVPTRKLMQPDTSRGSTIIQEEQDYVNSVVAPDLEMIEQKLVQTFDLSEEGLGIDLDESPILRADPMTRYNLGRVGVLSGLIATNEWRRGERLPPVPGGDEIRAPVNLAQLGSDMTGTAPDQAGRPPAGQPTPAVAEPATASEPNDAAPEG